MSQRTVRIGAGCSVDTTLAWPQMAGCGQLDYFLADYLYEAGVAAYAAERQQDPERGYSAEFASADGLLPSIKSFIQQGVKIITNAGGVNPLRCADRLRAVLAKEGLHPKIAVVHGDDVLAIVSQGGYEDMYHGGALPAGLISANAYLGAKPIAHALSLGADIVITGRVVDSALIVGPLMHAFGWAWDDYDRLAGATLIGHLLECGPQPSGGIYTDWREVDWSTMSFPLAECFDDGTAILTKVAGTGGQMSVGTAAEQILYEIGDPQRYIMPEVVCDLSDARLDPLGPDRVRVHGAKGRAPTSTYKVCCMTQAGWRAVGSGVISGPEAVEKAQRTGEAIVKRIERLAIAQGQGPLAGSEVEVIGGGRSQGARATGVDPREAVYRVVVDHAQRIAVEPLAKVVRATGVSMSPGTGVVLGVSVLPWMVMCSTLMDKALVPVFVTLDGRTEQIEVPTQGGFEQLQFDAPVPVAAADGTGCDRTVALVQLAWTRSGDKGNSSNVGVIARRPEYLPYLKAALTEQSVAAWYAHLWATPGEAHVRRFDVPGLNALNFMLYDGLAGGAVSSRRFDPMGKGLGQQLIDFPVPVPASLLP